MSTESTNAVFEIRMGLPGTDRDKWPTVRTYESGKDASYWLNNFKDAPACYMGDTYEQGMVFCIVRVDPDAPPRGDDDWIAREERRMTDGTYKPALWLTDPRFAYAAKVMLDAYPHHFPHVSLEDPCKIAFTESETKGRLDIQKRLRIDSYINRYMGGIVPKEMCEDILSAMLGTDIDVTIDCTKHGIVEAYERMAEEKYTYDDPFAVASCMTYEAGDFENSRGMHPTLVYGAGDLGIAYLEKEHDEVSLISARCMVWPDKKLFGRLYGEDSALLKAALRAKGYQEGTFQGARLLKVYIDEWDAKEWYLMPYLDGCQTVSDHGEYWTIGGGEYYCTNTEGAIGVEIGVTCEHCEERVSQDETSIVTVDGCDETWCDSCVTSEAERCNDCRGWFPSDELQLAVTHSRGYTDFVCPDCLASYYTETPDDGWIRDRYVTACDDCGVLHWDSCMSNHTCETHETLTPKPYHCTDEAQLALPISDANAVQPHLEGVN